MKRMSWQAAVAWVVGLSVLVGLQAFPQCQLANWNMEYADRAAAEAAGWEFLFGPWKLIAKGEFSAEPEAVREFPSGQKAMYFGEVTGGRGSYQLNRGVWGDLLSPWIELGRCPDCRYLSVSFKYCREVEYYTKGVYDETVVYLLFDRGQYGMERRDVWRKDSRDPSQKSWQSFVIPEPIEVPSDATRVRVVFYFNSVDGYANNYLGWLVDDVALNCAIPALKIETETLGQGNVGSYYNWHVYATGGFDGWDYEWSVVGTLPARLALEKTSGGPGWGEARIHGIPEVAGTFQFTIRVRSGRDLVAEKAFILAISAATAYWREDFGPVSPGWTATGLWHVTRGVSVPHPPGIVMYGPAAYYGKDDYTTPNYDTGARTRGFYTSPVVPIDPAYAGQRIKVAFKSWRWVEEYAGGSYDKTWVEVKLGAGDWIKVWEKDSRSPSEKAWTWEEVDTRLTVPSGTAATPFWIRFGFDSVDAHQNQHVGWLVDEVAVILIPAALAITTPCPLPDGWVGDDYRVELTAEGGVGARTWEAVGLPDGLSVRQEVDGSWVISGVPRRPTGREPAQVTLRVFDAERNRAEKTCALTIHAQQLLFKENFDDATAWNDWAATGLWRRTDAVPGVDLGPRGHVAYYGTTGGNYDTGARTTGSLTSPQFDTLGAPYAKVTFDYWREVESFAGAYDQTYVEVRFLVGGAWTAWTPRWTRDSSHPSTRTWESGEFAVAVPAGATKMQVRFVFDSVDKYYNRFVGWPVDNVKVVRTESLGPTAAVVVPKATPRDRISVFNYPNPVRDVHTTTFTVRGVEAERMRVEIYDLAGRLVYKAEAPGNELVWHTQDLTGLPLANGVYLYRVYVKVGGSWIATEVQKLVILR